MEQKQLIVGAVVLILAVTPTLLDSYQNWQDKPETRPWIVAIYLIAATVAFSAWRIFA